MGVPLVVEAARRHPGIRSHGSPLEFLQGLFVLPELVESIADVQMQRRRRRPTDESVAIDSQGLVIEALIVESPCLGTARSHGIADGGGAHGQHAEQTEQHKEFHANRPCHSRRARARSDSSASRKQQSNPASSGNWKRSS